MSVLGNKILVTKGFSGVPSCKLSGRKSHSLYLFTNSQKPRKSHSYVQKGQMDAIAPGNLGKFAGCGRYEEGK
jgi:hypothetical protein